MLGEVGKGYKIAIETLNEGRIGIGAQMIGRRAGRLEGRHGLRQGAQAVRQDASPSSRPCSSDLARMATDIEAARLLVYNAARLRDAGQPFLKEGGDGEVLLVARSPSA